MSTANSFVAFLVVVVVVSVISVDAEVVVVVGVAGVCVLFLGDLCLLVEPLLGETLECVPIISVISFMICKVQCGLSAAPFVSPLVGPCTPFGRQPPLISGGDIRQECRMYSQGL